MTTKPAPNDPNVQLPPAVIAAANRANELIAKTNKVVPDPELTPPPVVLQKTADTPSPPPPPPAPVVTPPPAAPVTSESNPPPPPPAPTSPAEPDWKARYDAMHGRFEQANRRSEQLSQQISGMQQLLASLNTQTPTPTPTPQPYRGEPIVTQKEREEFGNDFLDVVGKRAREIVNEVLQPIQQELGTFKQQIGGVTNAVVQDTQAKIWQALDTDIPNWREINSDPDFISWLGLPDVYSNAMRKQLLDAAFGSGSPKRVVAFFKGYLDDKAATRPVVEDKKSNGATAPQLDLASIAAPGRAKAAATNSVPLEKPIITRAQIKQFYEDARRGLYKGREAEYASAEKEIVSAGIEGRVR